MDWPGEHEAGEDTFPGSEGATPVDQPSATQAEVTLNDQHQGQVWAVQSLLYRCNW